ncbi:MAG: DNA polymerase III subunit gamma/tau [Clostridia bacterium]|nr:DNA polymerase III subunit gamma/tau [Clostridia bacterium]
MEYTSLYRKYRPTTFSEMVGQDHITKTLKNQVISGRIGHAYLFNGGRGTGKTSAAKILARAINCLNPKDGEPCNECEICKAMLEGSLTDVVEMDAASNNSVEDIRAIRDEVNFLPTLAKNRVYIIDEVHMLSTGAFNALLKTLEEPPAHVKFILATTEPQKLPATILSRCQRFDFKRLLEEDIVKRLQIVCKQSQIDITEEALQVIAVLAEGAARDALSILERCSQEKEGTIDVTQVKNLVGIPGVKVVSTIIKEMIQQNPEQALITLEEVLLDGKDLTNLLWEMIKYVKDLLVYKTTQTLKIYNKEELKEIAEISKSISKEKLIEWIYGLSEIENNMKWSTQKEIMLQTGLIKLSTNVNYDGMDELKKKVQELENTIKSGNIVVNSTQLNQTPKQETQAKVSAQKTVPKANIENLTSEQYWPKVIEQLKQTGKMVLYSNMINTKAKQKDDLTLEVIFPNGITKFGKDLLQRPENMQEIVRLVSMECGKEMRIKYIEGNEYVPKKEDSLEEKIKSLDIPVNIIEE